MANIHRVTLVLSFLSFFSIGLMAQSSDILNDLSMTTPNGGAVVIQEDTLLASFINLQNEVNANVSGITGFRVVLYRGSKVQTARDEANRVKTMFLEKHPDADVYQEYKPPVWRVLVGDYKTYGEALKMRNQLEKDLVEIKDNIYIVPMQVKYN